MVIEARIIEQFDKQWLAFQTQYSKPKTQQCVAYLQNEWLKEGQKERLINAWTLLRVLEVRRGHHRTGAQSLSRGVMVPFISVTWSWYAGP
jgi:hypothetical protein